VVLISLAVTVVIYAIAGRVIISRRVVIQTNPSAVEADLRCTRALPALAAGVVVIPGGKAEVLVHLAVAGIVEAIAEFSVARKDFALARQDISVIVADGGPCSTGAYALGMGRAGVAGLRADTMKDLIVVTTNDEQKAQR